MPIEDFIITVYCLIDDEVKKITYTHALCTRGFEPKLSDSEVIMMDIVGDFLAKTRTQVSGVILKNIGAHGFQDWAVDGVMQNNLQIYGQ